jgi:hypothetical protein
MIPQNGKIAIGFFEKRQIFLRFATCYYIMCYELPFLLRPRGEVFFAAEDSSGKTHESLWEWKLSELTRLTGYSIDSPAWGQYPLLRVAPFWRDDVFLMRFSEVYSINYQGQARIVMCQSKRICHYSVGGNRRVENDKKTYLG